MKRLILLALTLAFAVGCAGTREAYRKAEGLEDTAKVMTAHYYALVREANVAAQNGQLTGAALSHSQEIVAATRPAVNDLASAVHAWQAVASAETEAELDQAIVDAAAAISRLIDVLKQFGITGQAIDEAEQDLAPWRWRLLPAPV